MKRDRILRDRRREEILVTLKSGETFSGVLIDHDERHLVLLAASAVSADGSKVKADGSVVLPWDNVAYWQKP